jgi:hypothetical protein
VLERTRSTAAAAVCVCAQGALAAVSKVAVAVSVVGITLGLARALITRSTRVRTLHSEVTVLLTAAAVVQVIQQVGLTALAVPVAVRIARVAVVWLAAALLTARAAVLPGAALLALPAVLWRVRLDLAAVVYALIAVAIGIGAAHDLTGTRTTHGLGVWQVAARSGAFVDHTVAVVVAPVACFRAGTAAGSVRAACIRASSSGCGMLAVMCFTFLARCTRARGIAIVDVARD